MTRMRFIFWLPHVIFSLNQVRSIPRFLPKLMSITRENYRAIQIDVTINSWTTTLSPSCHLCLHSHFPYSLQIYDLIITMASIPITPLKLFASKVTNKLLIKSKGLLNTYPPCYNIQRTSRQCESLSTTPSFLKQSSLMLMTLSYLFDYSLIV